MEIHQPDLVGFLDDLLWPSRVAIVFPGHRADLLLSEVVGKITNRSLLVTQREIDHYLRSFALSGPEPTSSSCKFQAAANVTGAKRETALSR